MSQKNINEFCEILNISKENYIPFECGDTSIDVKLYSYLIKKIKETFLFKKAENVSKFNHRESWTFNVQKGHFYNDNLSKVFNSEGMDLVVT